MTWFVDINQYQWSCLWTAYGFAMLLSIVFLPFGIPNLIFTFISIIYGALTAIAVDRHVKHGDRTDDENKRLILIGLLFSIVYFVVKLESIFYFSPFILETNISTWYQLVEMIGFAMFPSMAIHNAFNQLKRSEQWDM